MSNIIKFTATRLKDTGKIGILRPDANGYYTIVLGGLNVYNSAGEYYVANGAMELFKKSSIFMRKVQGGNLYAELGHPIKTPEMTNDDYIRRIMRIQESNICGHISEVWLDMEYGKNNPDFKNPLLIAIMGKVKPTGPHGPVLEDSLSNSQSNTNFSIRALTNNTYVRGVVHRELVEIITWDYVAEAGLPLANKWSSPSLEDIYEQYITVSSIQRVASDVINNNVAVESERLLYQDLLDRLSVHRSTPGYSDW